MRFSLLFLWLNLLLSSAPALAQGGPPPARPDTLHKFENPAGVGAGPRRSFFRSKGFRAVAVPAVLIAYGASTINGHGLYSSYAVRSDLNHVFGPGRHTHVDDFLQYAPYLELGGVLLAGVESRNDRLNLGLVIVKSEVIMLGSVFAVKHLTHITRPDGSDDLSFPSGHTAQAFLAASIVHAELRDKSQWYGIGAYTVAAGVGVLRMVNDKHWQSDVLAGAGFGILSAHLAYLTHRNRWGRHPLGREVGLAPTWSPAGGTGLVLTWRPHQRGAGCGPVGGGGLARIGGG